MFERGTVPMFGSHVWLVVEAGGIEPPSESTSTIVSTRIVSALFLAFGPPGNRMPSSQPD